MLIEPVDEDPIRDFNDAEKIKLTHNLANLSRSIRRMDNKVSEYSVDIILIWHSQLFRDVRDHAGRFRSRDYGEEILIFGGHRSVHRNEVLAKIENHIKNFQNLISQLDNHQPKISPTIFVSEVIKVALFLHAEFIKIHPFRDGNGRVGRLIITFILSNYQIPPLAFEVPKDEYINCLNKYYLTNDLDPLYKLSLRIYNNQI